MVDEVKLESMHRAALYLQRKKDQRWTDRINNICLCAILSLIVFSLVLAVIAYA